jgi:EAL domain-containing protein (putative c-di-GMP-specific phosphodiesterase class I)
VNYSSMQYLKNIPISLIKIDQGFVRDMFVNSSNAKIVNAIVQLSHGLNIHSIAEGVETKEQFDMLKEMGCEYIQGHYFAAAMILSDVLEHPILLTGRIKK